MAFHGMRWRQIDPSGLVIRLLAALGLVWNVKSRRRRRSSSGGADAPLLAEADR